MRAALYWLAAQSGPPPEEIATGDLVGWQAMIHKNGAWRAKGGSGALTQALARCLRAMGGEVLTDQPVSRIARGSGGGKARFEVRTGEGQGYAARSVAAACHVQTTFRAARPGARARRNCSAASTTCASATASG